MLDVRSNTMRMGVHADRLADSLAKADLALLCENTDLSWDIHQMAATAPTIITVQPDTRRIIEYLVQNCQRGDQVVIMSNGGFDGIHHRLVEALQS